MLKTKELHAYIQSALAATVETAGFRWEANRSVSLKKTKTARYTLGYHVLKYDRFVMYGMGASITFPVLEKLVMPSLEKSGLMGQGSIRGYRTNRCIGTQFQTHFGERAVIQSFDDLEAVIEIYKKSIIETYLPYFNQFNDLNEFYHFMKAEQDRDRLVDLLSTIFYEFKLMALYRLCNDERYESYMNDYYNSLKKATEFASVDPYLLQFWAAIQDLKPILDKTKPIYNL